VGASATTEVALLAWDHAILTLGELGHPVAGMILHHDQDSVFTSHAWTARVLLEHGIKLSYALRGARDNPEMESFFGRFKVENRSLLLDAATLAELKAVVAQRIAYHNHDRRHSSLANTTPAAFLSRWRSGRRSQT
jgi:putative transposase